MSAPLADVADQLVLAVDAAVPRLQAIEAESARPWADGKWTRQQVLGHLVDSALNNYHRVIRAQQGAELRFPDYDQRHWVDAGAYVEREWQDLVQLWSQLNLQLAHVIARISDAALGRVCQIGDGAPMTLEDVVRDYPRHLQHHLRQILDSAAAAGRTHPPFRSA